MGTETKNGRRLTIFTRGYELGTKIFISGERGNCKIVSVLILNTDRMAP